MDQNCNSRWLGRTEQSGARVKWELATSQRPRGDAQLNTATLLLTTISKMLVGKVQATLQQNTVDGSARASTRNRGKKERKTS